MQTAVGQNSRLVSNLLVFIDTIGSFLIIKIVDIIQFSKSTPYPSPSRNSYYGGLCVDSVFTLRNGQNAKIQQNFYTLNVQRELLKLNEASLDNCLFMLSQIIKLINYSL
jgi:hypothetical protein